MGDIIKIKKRSAETVMTASDQLLQAIINDGNISRAQALQIPAVSRAVDLISDIFAMIPFKLYREQIINGKKVTKEVNDYRVTMINDDTSDTLDGFQLKKAICQDYMLAKGGYCFVARKGRQFRGLYYVEPDVVSFTTNTDPIYKQYSVMIQGNTYNDFELIKLLRNTKNGYYGEPITNEISKSLLSAYKRISYELELAATGGSRKGFLMSKKSLSKEALQALKSAWQNYYEGNTSTVILNDGMEFKEASCSSRENEIAEKEKCFEATVNELFHIGSKYEDTIKTAIMPICTAFCTQLNRYLLLEDEKARGYYYAPDLRELNKGSLRERYEAYKIAIETGFRTRNEIRYEEDLNELKGLDVINLGLSAVLLNPETGEIYTPNTNKTVQVDELSKGGM